MARPSDVASLLEKTWHRRCPRNRVWARGLSGPEGVLRLAKNDLNSSVQVLMPREDEKFSVTTRGK